MYSNGEGKTTVYTVIILETPCVNSNPCQNGGRCYVSQWADQYYRCGCYGRWYGKNCTKGISATSNLSVH